MTRNNILRFFLLSVFVFSFKACSVGPKEITYGSDGCHYCKMTIVDKIHGAELVTKKGKIFKFDAMECMINHLNEIDVNDVALFLSNHYSEPEELINAKEATFLISENLPSPMGAFLTAFENQDDAAKTRAEKGGNLYGWNELIIKLNNKDVSNIREHSRKRVH